MAARGLVATARTAATLYAAYAAAAWFGYGRVTRAVSEAGRVPLLDALMPEFEVRVGHRVRVRAPADVTMRVAREMDIERSPIVRAIFKGRELMLGARPDEARRPRPLVAFMESLGWRVLAEDPGREIVLGAAMRPWQADVVFRGLAPDEFRAFQEPGFAKVAWTLRADPLGPEACTFSTETRVVTTDPESRARFRRYWALASPGMLLVRLAALRMLKREAERKQGR